MYIVLWIYFTYFAETCVFSSDVQFDADFYFYNPAKTGQAFTPLPFLLNSSSLSVGLWLRYEKPGDTGTVLSLYGMRSAKYHVTLNHPIKWQESTYKLKCTFNLVMNILFQQVKHYWRVNPWYLSRSPDVDHVIFKPSNVTLQIRSGWLGTCSNLQR